MISEKVASRKKLFADYGGDYASYLKATGKVLPNIIIVINGFELYNENYGDATFDLLATITRDCQKYGVYFVMTSTTANGIRSRLAQYLPNHICFQMNDKYDYSSLLARTKLEPSNIVGRGLVKLDTVYEFQAAVPCDKENLSTIVLEKIEQLIQAYPNVSAPKVPVLPDVVTISYCKEKLTGLNSVPVGVEKESLNIRTLDFTKNLVHVVTCAEMAEAKTFTGLFIKEVSSLIGKNCYVFDMEKMYPEVASTTSYFDSAIFDNFKNFGKTAFDAFEKYKAAGFDAGALNDQAESVCFIIGFDKFKNVMGTDFDSAFAGLVSMIKTMPKFNFVLLDTCDNFKKREFETWYKDTISGTKGIWLGNGMGTQYTIKSTTPARLLSAKLDKHFGYYVDGNTTVLVKFISESGEEEQQTYETL
jgi:S-DNA-T family DNA segregation ATPase FtsK/SpoIIIE